MKQTMSIHIPVGPGLEKLTDRFFLFSKIQQVQSSQADPYKAIKSADITRDTAPQHERIVSKDNTKVMISLASGGVAGACAKSVIAPLELVKIMFQITNKKFSVMEAFRTVRRVYHEEGARALWRGNTATMARIIPFAAIQFTSHEHYSYLLRNSDDHLTPAKRFIAGALAGATATTCTYPLDLMRARLAVHRHNGIIDGLRTLRQEGLWVFYRGLKPTLVGIIPYAGTSFLTYELLGATITQYYNIPEISVGQRLLCGAVAGLTGQSLSYPLDIVRRRMQTDGHATERKYYTVLQ
eukprot:Ihof_evm3s131 gene=Ihof_evmTU3s131